MFNSSNFWEGRYAKGGNSGSGSYGLLAAFKAEVINNAIKEFGLNNAIEFGCGDGNQLGMFKFKKYIGLDVSETVLSKCKNKYSKDSTKIFLNYKSSDSIPKQDCAMSIDVIFHLIEDNVFAEYMKKLFAASNKMIIIYSSNYDGNSTVAHVKHRHITKYIEANFPTWKLVRTIPNKYPYPQNPKGSFCQFYFYSCIR